jgi:hypothetical protein
VSDRELLELAAKAAGTYYVEGKSWDENAGWNPLTDDGDALRLAVKLEMDFVWDFDRIEIYYGTEKDYVVEYFYDLPTPTDRYAATRRAIVRAAAFLELNDERRI